MKNKFLIFVFALAILASFSSEAQKATVLNQKDSYFWQIAYDLGDGDVTFVIPASSIPGNANGIVAQALFHNCASQDNGSVVQLRNGAYLQFDATKEAAYEIDSDDLGAALAVDTLSYVTADGESDYEYWKGAFYKSDLLITIDAAATATDSSGVDIAIWILTEEK